MPILPFILCCFLSGKSATFSFLIPATYFSPLISYYHLPISVSSTLIAIKDYRIRLIFRFITYSHHSTIVRWFLSTFDALDTCFNTLLLIPLSWQRHLIFKTQGEIFQLFIFQFTTSTRFLKTYTRSLFLLRIFTTLIIRLGSICVCLPILLSIHFPFINCH